MRRCGGTSFFWCVNATNSTIDKVPKVFLPQQVIRRKYGLAPLEGTTLWEIYSAGRSENGRGGGGGWGMGAQST